MLIDVQIPGGPQSEIEAAMLGEQFQHMIQKADSRENVVRAASFDTQAAADLSLFGVALERGFSHKTLSIWFTLSKIATAFSCWKSRVSSSRLEWLAAMMPMKGTPAAGAERASTMGSPAHQSLAPGFTRWMACNPSGAGLGFETFSAQTMGSKRKPGAKRASVMSSS